MNTSATGLVPEIMCPTKYAGALPDRPERVGDCRECSHIVKEGFPDIPIKKKNHNLLGFWDDMGTHIRK